MTINQQTELRQESALRSGTRQLLGNRFGLLAIAALVLGLGAYSSWGWLVAAGLAPILLSVAPCAAMCALGLCTMGRKPKLQDQQITNVADTKDKGMDCCS